MGRVEVSQLWDVTCPFSSSPWWGPSQVRGLIPPWLVAARFASGVEIPGMLNSPPTLPGVAGGRKGSGSPPNPQQKGQQRWYDLTEVLVSRRSGKPRSSSERFSSKCSWDLGAVCPRTR